MVFQTVGASTRRLATYEPGQAIANVLGPLGMPSEIKNYGAVIAVGGGIGAAPLYPIVESLKAAGNTVHVIIGARSKELIIFEERMRAIADDVTIVTDDGSYGRKALVTEPLKEACQEQPKPALAIAIGPPIMMKFCEKTTAALDVPLIVSLNTIMIDGTGMCGCCRVLVGGKTRFVCVDGPDFDGHQVDFDNMMTRMGAYREREQADDHKCKLELGLIQN
jgi:ferredoxin--NADP+ reductase